MRQKFAHLKRELREGEQARRRAAKAEKDLRTAVPSPPRPPLRIAERYGAGPCRGNDGVIAFRSRRAASASSRVVGRSSRHMYASKRASSSHHGGGGAMPTDCTAVDMGVEGVWSEHQLSSGSGSGRSRSVINLRTSASGLSGSADRLFVDQGLGVIGHRVPFGGHWVPFWGDLRT